MAPSKIRVQGRKVANNTTRDNAVDLQLQIDATYQVGAATRGDTDSIDIELRDDNLVEFTFSDDTVWMSSPDSLHELFPEINVQRRGGAEVAVLPMVLRADEAQSRGIVKDIALKVIKVFTKKLVSPIVHELAIDLENKQLENNVGLYRLIDGFTLKEETIPASEKPYLLFIHGTASSTSGSFASLEKDDTGRTTAVWSAVREKYEDRIIAFNHRSLSESPLQNVKLLIDKLPKGATLHLVSHSRGGIVGDVLSRFCISEIDYKGFSANEINYLLKNDRQTDVDLIAEIGKKAASKNIKVEKFIRVACPASGTTLASTRLDHLFNIIFNLLGLATAQAANPIFIAFKNLLAAVVESKNDPKVLPGLEVQSPDSPFINMMNNPQPAAQISAPLLVISGNSQFAVSWKGLLVITTKLFFMGKNDFVVDTRSMYNGAKRAEDKVQYFFDESPATSHFNYFANDITRRALLQAFQSDGNSLIPGFVRGEQVSTDQAIRNALLKLQHGEEFRDSVSGRKPIAVLLPGIMGSNLAVNGDRVWINYMRFLTGGLMRIVYNDDNNKNVVARSLIETSYSNLANYLESSGYDVVTFPFDWRLSLNDSASRLDQKLNELMKFGQPIKLIGHSMGGVLIRDFIINHGATWQKLNKTKDFRLLFLGAPLGGSFRIPYVMFGEDDIIKTLGKADLTHTRRELLNLFNSMPGLLCLLPLTKDADNDYAKPDTWKKMRSGFSDTGWPLPSDAALTAFGAYRDNILRSKDTIDFTNAVYIAGQSRPDNQTPLGYRIVNGKIVFLATKEGDESVTWATGIPQVMIDKGTVYYSQVPHGELANDKSIFPAISEVLANGATTKLKKTRPALRAMDMEFEAKPTFSFDMSETGVTNKLMGLGTVERDLTKPMPVAVSVCHGDLKYARFLVLAGHFFKDGLFSAEKAIDRSLDGELARRRQLGQYPGEIGTNEVVLAADGKNFKGAIIAGLGRQGELNSYQLARTVELAVMRHLASYNSGPEKCHERADTIGISTLAIGSGYGGLSVELSIRAIIQGVQNANEKIRVAYPAGALVGELEFIELFRDKALAGIYALNSIERDENSGLHIVWKSRKIKDLLGRSERIPVDNVSDWWTRITVSKSEDGEDGCKCDGNILKFAMSTGAAREEKSTLCTGQETVMKMLEQMGKNGQWTPELAKTIFELMIPQAFKEQVKKQNNINWIVDKNTASIPWEMLQDSVDAIPLSVSAGMVRQMATKDFKERIGQVVEHTALVIGDPELGKPEWQLSGAETEAQEVAQIMQANRFMSGPPLIRSSAAEILQALFSGSYKIMHLAGHGTFSEKPGEPTGMLIGDGAYLTPCEISQMSAIPELVFMNCCYLGEVDGKAERTSQNLHRMAANIGTELIDKGVKAVIVAGWAVDDAAALDFAKEFYSSMFEGRTFGEAVKCARKYIYDRHHRNNNTWGAYQCYGDPFYKLTRLGEEDDMNPKYSFSIIDEAEIKLSNLYNKMEAGDFNEELAVRSIQAVAEALNKAGIARSNKVIETEARIMAGLGKYGESIKRYEELFEKTKAEYPVTAIEKYCNVRAKYYLAEYQKDPKQAKELVEKVGGVIEELKDLMRICGRSAERLNISGSAYKRRAMMQKGKDKQGSYVTAAKLYGEANIIMRNDFYPLANWLSIENALVLAGVKTWDDVDKRKKDPKDKDAVVIKNKKDAIDLLKAKLGDAAWWEEYTQDFWKMTERANLMLCLLLLGDKETTFDMVFAAYKRTWDIAGHLGNKQAETEHMDFLEDLLSIVPDGKAKKLIDLVVKLRDNLRAMM